MPDPLSLLNACPACSNVLDVSELEPFSKVNCPHCRQSIRVRHQFHHFVIKEEIGVGGMSRVFRALDSALNREVALKILNRQCSSDQRRVEQFEREARITASISHPNVVKVFSSGWDQGFFYIAMELVTGGSLDSSIRQHSRLSEAYLLDTAQQLTRGFKAAHDAGLIHRDIKPGNVLFAEDGTPKIVDFGLALMVQERDTDTEIWATPFYVPPEKLCSEPEDHRSDIYSLGATLFHAAYGRPPYDNDTVNMEELRVIKSQPVLLSKAESSFLSPAATEVLLTCLKRQPKDRYQDYATLLKHLEIAKQRPQSRKLGKNAKPIYQRPAVLATAAAALVAGGFLANRKPESPVKETSSGSLREMLKDDPLASSDKTVSQQYNAARQALLAGDIPSAREGYVKLATIAPQPTKNWCYFHIALADWFKGDTKAASETIGKLQTDITGEQSSFFAKAKHLLEQENAVPPEHSAEIDANGYTAMGLLAAGMKNWGLGLAAECQQPWERFLAGDPAKQGWANAYRPLAEKALAQAKQITSLPELTPNSPELAELGKKYRQLASTLPASPPKAAIEKLLTAYAGAIDGAQTQMDTAKATAELDALEATFLPTSPSQPWDLVAAEERMKAIPTTTKAAEEQKQLIQKLIVKAQQLLPQLARTALSGEIDAELLDGTLLHGKIISADATSLKLQSTTPGTAEQDLLWAKLQPRCLLKIAELPLTKNQVTDTDEYYDRRQSIVAFAYCTGQRHLAAVKGAMLALELPTFRGDWDRLAPRL